MNNKKELLIIILAFGGCLMIAGVIYFQSPVNKSLDQTIDISAEVQKKESPDKQTQDTSQFEIYSFSSNTEDLENLSYKQSEQQVSPQALDLSQIDPRLYAAYLAYLDSQEKERNLKEAASSWTWQSQGSSTVDGSNKETLPQANSSTPSSSSESSGCSSGCETVQASTTDVLGSADDLNSTELSSEESEEEKTLAEERIAELNRQKASQIACGELLAISAGGGGGGGGKSCDCDSLNCLINNIPVCLDPCCCVCCNRCCGRPN